MSFRFKFVNTLEVIPKHCKLSKMSSSQTLHWCPKCEVGSLDLSILFYLTLTYSLSCSLSFLKSPWPLDFRFLLFLALLLKIDCSFYWVNSILEWNLIWMPISDSFKLISLSPTPFGSFWFFLFLLLLNSFECVICTLLLKVCAFLTWFQ